MNLTLPDLLQRFALTMDDFDPIRHDAWASAEVIECLQRIGVHLTSERVEETITLLPGSLLPLPTGCVRWYEVRQANGSGAGDGAGWYSINKVGNMLHLRGYGGNKAVLIYERLATDSNNELIFDALTEPALFAWLKWRWMELRPMKDQVGELRKGSLALVDRLQRNAEDAVGEVRGLLNLVNATPSHMSGLGRARSSYYYRNP